jgi:hypothetical protein
MLIFGRNNVAPRRRGEAACSNNICRSEACQSVLLLLVQVFDGWRICLHDERGEVPETEMLSATLRPIATGR